jgi:hypothetical protein
MPFQLINVGTRANASDGDPLRTALQKVNDNFRKLANVGPINGTALVITSRTANTDSNLAMTWSASNNTSLISSTSLTNGNIQIAPRGTGRVILPSNAYVSIQGGLNGQFLATRGNGQLYWTYASAAVQAAGGNYQIQYNINTALSANASLTYNPSTGLMTVPAVTATTVTAANYLYPNGTSIVSSYNNQNVANYLPTYSGTLNPTSIQNVNNLTVNTIKGVNLITGASAQFNYILANTALTATSIVTQGIRAAAYYDQNGNLINFGGNGNVTANIGVTQITSGNSQIVVTPSTGQGMVTLTSNYGDANVDARFGVVLPNNTSNVQALYFLGNGALLTGVTINYSNANVANYLTGLTSNVTTTANIAGSYLLGNGAFLTGLNNNYGNANVAAYLLVYTGNVAAGNVTVSGNISAGYVLGNGSQLTGLPTQYANANVAAYLPVYTGNIAAGNVIASGTVFSYRSNVTDTLTVTGTVRTTSIHTDNYYYANGTPFTGGGSNITIQGGNVNQILAGTGVTISPPTGLGTVTVNATYSNANVQGYVPTILDSLVVPVSTSNLISATGGLRTAGNVGAAQANVTGTVSAAYFIGDGSNLTNINYNNANVAAYLPTYTGNITAGNVTITGAVRTGSGLRYSTAQGTANTLQITDGSNLAAATGLTYTSGQLTATGNVTAARFVSDVFVYANGQSILANISGGGGSGASGSNTQIQYNNSGILGSSNNFTYNRSSNTLSVPTISATTVTASGGINGTLVGAHYGAVYASTITANANITGVAASFTGTVTANNFISTGAAPGGGNLNITAVGNLNLRSLNQITANAPVKLASYTTGALPTAAAGAIIYISSTNRPAYYNGSSWRYFDGTAV